MDLSKLVENVYPQLPVMFSMLAVMLSLIPDINFVGGYEGILSEISYLSSHRK